MARGLSIHIGLNYVDPDSYDGWNGELFGCINDANDMKSLADGLGYESDILIDGEATADAVKGRISDAAASLFDGDILLLTYSGHGGQLDDITGDEDDTLDETWVLYDRELLDDEIYELLGQLQSGVRAFVLSDSCHSGTVLRMYRELEKTEPIVRAYTGKHQRRKAGQKARKRTLSQSLRVMPDDVRLRTHKKRYKLYSSLRQQTPSKRDIQPSASVILISGCQDNQLSADGDGNGLFTSTLLQTWSDGAFSGTYYDFWSQIASAMPVTQSPNYYKVGAENPDFENQRPFTIDAGVEEPVEPVEPVDEEPVDEEPVDEEPIDEEPVDEEPTSDAPAVVGPASWTRGNGSPTFDVTTGSNPYYVFEIFTDPSLIADWNQRTSENSYMTWDDPEESSRLEGSSYELPTHAWERLNWADGLYFRIGTTSSVDGWDNYQVSTPDDAPDSAPVVLLEG